MADSDVSPARTRPHRVRASGACQRCRKRRERCDATVHGVPCTRCEANGIPNCTMGISRRGKYARRHSAGAGAPEPDAAAAAQQGPAPGHPPNGPGTTAQPLLMAPQTESWDDSPSVSRARPVKSYRELSWTALFQHFVDSQGLGQDEAVDKCAITYLGESFPLSSVLDSFTEGAPTRLHHAGPKIADSEAEPRADSPSPPVAAEDLAWLNAKGAFEYPDAQLLQALKSAFVTRVFPLYPIVDLDETLRLIDARKLPWILLHAICFVAAGAYPAAALNHAGSRYDMRQRFHARAKALFDVSYEANRLVLLQASIFMSFSIGRPNEYWNCWAWMATAVTLAETLGLHRSMAASNVAPRDRSLLRRVWWVLVIRDASMSSLVGRPFRITSQQCDMEMLSLEDFKYDVQSPLLEQHPLRDTFGLYQIHIAKLGCLLRQIILSCYSPGRLQENTTQFNDALDDWMSELPPVFKVDQGETGKILGRCLLMNYHHHKILANLRAPNTLALSQPVTGSNTLVDNAAQMILSLACKVVRSSSLPLMPHEAFSSLFLAEVVFLRQAKSRDKSLAATGRASLTTCQVLWYTVSDTWDSAPWVMELFDKMTAVLDRSQDEANALSLQGSEIDEGMMESFMADPAFGSAGTSVDSSLDNAFPFNGLGLWNFPFTETSFQ